MPPRDSPRTYSPSDLPAELQATQELRLGGRVTRFGSGTIELGDAFSSCELHIVRGLDTSRVDVGSLVTADVSVGLREGRQELLARRLEPSGGSPSGASDRPGACGPRSRVAERTRGARIAAALVARAGAERVVRTYFERDRFLEVTTPHRVAAPGTDVYIEPQPSDDAFLITSPELHMKRLLVAGFPRIYQFAQCHRRAELGPWHQPEFCLLEWYRAFASYTDVLHDTEQLVSLLASHLASPAGESSGASCLNTTPLKRLRLLRESVPDEIEISPPFPRISVSEAFDRFAGGADACALSAQDEDRYFQLMVDAVEPALAEFRTPVFLTDYPVAQAALARPNAADPSTAERFELFIAGVELCNGYGELTEPGVQRRRFEQDRALRQEKGLPDLPLDEAFLSALEEGMPPSGGNALGLERLLALLLQVPLSEVLTFPATA